MTEDEVVEQIALLREELESGFRMIVQTCDQIGVAAKYCTDQ